MTNKTDNESNNLLGLLSPAVPGSFNTAQKEPLTYHYMYQQIRKDE